MSFGLDSTEAICKVCVLLQSAEQIWNETKSLTFSLKGGTNDKVINDLRIDICIDFYKLIKLINEFPLHLQVLKAKMCYLICIPTSFKSQGKTITDI